MTFALSKSEEEEEKEKEKEKEKEEEEAKGGVVDVGDAGEGKDSKAARRCT